MITDCCGYCRKDLSDFSAQMKDLHVAMCYDKQMKD